MPRVDMQHRGHHGQTDFKVGRKQAGLAKHGKHRKIANKRGKRMRY